MVRANVDPSFEYERSQGRFDDISLDLAGQVYLDRLDSELHLRLHPDGIPDRVLPVDVSSYEDETLTFRPHLDGMLVFPLSDFVGYYDGIVLSNYLVRLRPVTSLPIHFADPRLEEALQEILGLGEAPVTVGQLSAMEELRLDGLGITDLRGLENARRLKLLSITNNELTNLEPLRDLTIDQLFVTGNPIAASGSEIALEVVRLSRSELEPSFPLGVVGTSSLDLYVRWETEVGGLYRVEVSQDLKDWTIRSHVVPAFKESILYGLTEPFVRVSRR